MNLRKTEKRKLKRLLLKYNESEGIVSRMSDGTFRFDEKKPLLMSAKTFHTHNVRDKHGGFDPPSRKDMKYLLRFAKKGHYVVSHRGLYYVKIDCKVRTQTSRALIRTMKDLQQRLPPGPRYNARYMKEVNGLAPKCLKVTFTPWNKL